MFMIFVINVINDLVLVWSWSLGCSCLAMMVLHMMITLSLVFDMNIGLFGLWSLVSMLQSSEMDIADVTEE